MHPWYSVKQLNFLAVAFKPTVLIPDILPYNLVFWLLQNTTSISDLRWSWFMKSVPENHHSMSHQVLLCPIAYYSIYKRHRNRIHFTESKCACSLKCCSLLFNFWMSNLLSVFDVDSIVGLWCQSNLLSGFSCQTLRSPFGVRICRYNLMSDPSFLSPPPPPLLSLATIAIQNKIKMNWCSCQFEFLLPYFWRSNLCVTFSLTHSSPSALLSLSLSHWLMDGPGGVFLW